MIESPQSEVRTLIYDACKDEGIYEQRDGVRKRTPQFERQRICVDKGQSWNGMMRLDYENE